MPNRDGRKHVHVMVDDSLVEWLKAWAKRQHRTVNQQLNFMIEQAKEADEKEPK